ncbi:somatostatin receptor type 5-like isoform X2 [Genypterus blacodes]|uniref:somatostatin receptor type 5-like isoform X2 n=1 Tax=Genypterus blacodes TaxID=154954 RepID=UPI003F771771
MDRYNWTSAAKDVSTSSSTLYSNGNSTVHNSSDETDTVPFIGSSTMVTTVIYITVFVVGLLGNSLSIFVVARYAKMKTVTNIYILNLALADELYILGIPFLGTQSVLSYWPYGEFLCKVYMTADTMSQFTSTFCLTVMSIDRYLAVVQPIRSGKWRRPQRAKVCNAMVWVVSFLVALPVTISSDVQDRFNSCNMSWPEPQQVWSTTFILYTCILGFFGPLVIICLCYLLIVIEVRSASMRVGLTKKRKSERKVTRMVVIIVLVFVLCWLPFYTANIVNLIYTIPENDTAATVYSFLVILTYVNSCANPILYGFLSDNFNKSFQKVLCVRKHSSVGSSATTEAKEAKPNRIQNGKTQRDGMGATGSVNDEALTAATDLSFL